MAAMKADRNFNICAKIKITIVRISVKTVKYDKQDQQGKAAFNKRNPHTTPQQQSTT
jgi:hypothetical protein